jgi:penicillin-binding protein 1A
MRIVVRILGSIFAAVALLGVTGAAAVGVFIWHYNKGLPDHAQLQNWEPPIMTRVHGADGVLLAEYYRAESKRLYLPYEAIPKILIGAYLSAEDKNFFTHGGIDPEGLVRAMITNVRRGTTQGASTITQQVAKNFLLSSDQTYDRKIKEALIALKIEATLPKEKILELYLNYNNLGSVTGPSNYGIAAAALGYFGKAVSELTIAESAYLAALPKAPNGYHPFRNRERAVGRRNDIIDLMVTNGYINRQEGDAAKAEALTVVARDLSPNRYAAGFFAEEVRRELAERYGETKLYEGGLSVRTTLDVKMQVMARKALTDGLVRYDEARGWRGAFASVPVGSEWGAELNKLPIYEDIQPWRAAAVLDVSDKQITIGLQPRRDVAGNVVNERVTGVINAEGTKWTRKKLTQLVNSGDVIYAEPIDKKPGEYRLRQIPEVSGALAAMDPNTGRVLAMVGGFSFDQSEFNRATQALRQPGSSFKPFVYAAALDNGYTPSTMVEDKKIQLRQADGTFWEPENYDEREGGPRTLRYGLEHSKNLMTIRLAQDVGMPLVVEYARRFGVYDDLMPVLSMSLGAGETTVMRMVTGYSMLANGGKAIRPTMIDRIQDRWGKTIYRHDARECTTCSAIAWEGQDEPKLIDSREQVIDPMTAYQVTSMLEGVVQRGTAQIVKEVGKPLAGKTGTTNDAKDVWFVGFSPDLVVGIYMGYDKPRSLGDQATAGVYAAPIFRDFMKLALAGKPPLTFRPPAGTKFIRVSAKSGQRVDVGTGDAIMEAFKPGTAPPESVVFASGNADAAANALNGGEPRKVAPRPKRPKPVQNIDSGAAANSSTTGGLY